MTMSGSVIDDKLKMPCAAPSAIDDDELQISGYQAECSIPKIDYAGDWGFNALLNDEVFSEGQAIRMLCP